VVRRRLGCPVGPFVDLGVVEGVGAEAQGPLDQLGLTGAEVGGVGEPEDDLKGLYAELVAKIEEQGA